jgi:hypothetical protein
MMKATSALMVFLLLAGCASSGGQRLTLDTRQVSAVEYLPDEVTAMLEDLGYEVMPEPKTQRLAQSFENYKLQFKARDAENIRVDVDFKLNEKLTRMLLYTTNEKTPSAATLQRYQLLKARLQQEFGVDSIK